LTSVSSRHSIFIHIANIIIVPSYLLANILKLQSYSFLSVESLIVTGILFFVLLLIFFLFSIRGSGWLFYVYLLLLLTDMVFGVSRSVLEHSAAFGKFSSIVSAIVLIAIIFLYRKIISFFKNHIAIIFLVFISTGFTVAIFSGLFQPYPLITNVSKASINLPFLTTMNVLKASFISCLDSRSRF